MNSEVISLWSSNSTAKAKVRVCRHQTGRGLRLFRQVRRNGWKRRGRGKLLLDNGSRQEAQPGSAGRESSGLGQEELARYFQPLLIWKSGCNVVQGHATVLREGSEGARHQVLQSH